ncbi:MAG: hypothetical protein HYX69_17675 [Planctomycetia bacterium]|nr:hypothetical protein [Planctomycetia bacterium]
MDDKLSVTSSLNAASGTAADCLFPLRFTPFELYFLCEDRPDFAGLIPIELEARGRLDRAALERAYALTHIRHPLLSARIEPDRKGWPFWVTGKPEPIRYDDSVHDRSRAGSAPGVQVHVRTKGDWIQFLFVFHHVAVDGLGAFQFIGDLFVAYAHACTGSGEPPPWRRLEPERLRDRDGHQLFNRKVRPVDLLRMAKVHLPLSLRQAALVSEEKGRQSGDQTVAGLPTDFLVQHLTEEETTALSRVAAKQSARLNDLLVRDYFLMLADWNRGTSQARRPLRILIPTNMRRREDLLMPAANVFSYAFLTRRAADCKDRERLLAWTRDEMAAMKRDNRGLYYEAALRLICLWPAFLRWSLNRKWAFATAVFTNLGTGFDRVPLPTREGRKTAGDLFFEIGAGAGPIRPDTRISFAAHIYAGRLAIGARCDPQSLTPSQHQALLDAYIDQLKMTTACGT